MFGYEITHPLPAHKATWVFKGNQRHVGEYYVGIRGLGSRDMLGGCRYVRELEEQDASLFSVFFSISSSVW